MQNLGGGVSFTENDLEMAKVVLGLINQSKYNLAPQQILQAAQALQWFRGILLVGIEENIFELKKVIDTKGASELVEPKGKGKK